MTGTARAASPARSRDWQQPGHYAGAKQPRSGQALLTTTSAEELAMSTIRIETVPQTWNDDTDTAFFTITARLFSAEFAYGASVLLASFDTDTVADQATSAVTGTAAPAVTSFAANRDLAPVAVRRTR
jgi:hypothetical protein